MAFSLSATQREELFALCRKYAVRELKLFGSATTNAYDELQSDLDFLVEFYDPPAQLGLAAQFFGLQEELSALFGKNVDLLEEHAIENSHLRRSAEVSAQLLYAA